MYLKTISCLLLLLFSMDSVSANDFFEILIQEWKEWKLSHGKSYSDLTEDRWRFKIFRENRIRIAKHNIMAHMGQHSYFMGMNHFGDLLPHEFVASVNGYNSSYIRRSRGASYIPSANAELPKEIDWRAKGAVTGVKDQGQCGSCWSFSATGSLEGQEFRKTGKLVSLSEQNLIDCSTSFGNNGCNGGLMDLAFRYIKENGIDSENSYPYEGRDGVCRFKEADEAATDVGFVDIESGNEMQLQHALATVGPISIAMDASLNSLQFYSSGIYDDPECSSTILDHGVLAVGYGVENENDEYYIIKNSWSEKWGEEGYFRLARNKNNRCGVATQASYPLV